MLSCVMGMMGTEVCIRDVLFEEKTVYFPQLLTLHFSMDWTTVLAGIRNCSYMGLLGAQDRSLLIPLHAWKISTIIFATTLQ